MTVTAAEGLRGRSRASTRPASGVALSFVIPVRNDAARLARCLQSIREASIEIPVEVLVVDHDSSDGSRTVAEGSGATVLRGTGRNVAALRNGAAAHASTPLLAFVDADHLLAPGWVEAAVRGMNDDAIGAVGTPCFAPADGTWVQRTYDALRRHPERPEAAEWFGAGNMVVRASAFRAVGGFDERIESCEDVDLCFRLRAAGWQLRAVPALKNVHLGDPATLQRLFTSELWRGRNNLRVSLRAPWSLRNAISTAVPVVQLLSAPVAIGSVLAGGALAAPIAGLAIACALVPTLGRVAAMRRNASQYSAAATLRCLGVAATYDAARALALLVSAPHHRRHLDASPRQPA